MAQWRPDDSLLDRNAKGELKGARKVNEVLRKGGIRRANRVTTSRDPGMTAAKNALKRTGMPAGVEQWQLPVALISRRCNRAAATPTLPGSVPCWPPWAG